MTLRRTPDRQGEDLSPLQDITSPKVISVDEVKRRLEQYMVLGPAVGMAAEEALDALADLGGLGDSISLGHWNNKDDLAYLLDAVMISGGPLMKRAGQVMGKLLPAEELNGYIHERFPTAESVTAFPKEALAEPVDTLLARLDLLKKSDSKFCEEVCDRIEKGDDPLLKSVVTVFRQAESAAVAT